jgi:hypothetical protein
VNAELAGLSSAFDPAPCRPAREIVNVSKHFSCNSLRSMCVQGSSNPQYAKEYEIFLKMLKPPFNMIPPRPHNAHPRVFFTDENRTDMVFVIDVPANMFDMQFIYGDEILESEFLEQKQCFGLTEPINTIFSVNALTESFWKVFGREAKQEQREPSHQQLVRQKIQQKIESFNKERSKQAICVEDEIAEEAVQYESYYPWEEYGQEEWLQKKHAMSRYTLPRCRRVVGDARKPDLELKEGINSFRLMTFRQLVEMDREWMRDVLYIFKDY